LSAHFFLESAFFQGCSNGKKAESNKINAYGPVLSSELKTAAIGIVIKSGKYYNELGDEGHAAVKDYNNGDGKRLEKFVWNVYLKNPKIIKENMPALFRKMDRQYKKMRLESI